MTFSTTPSKSCDICFSPLRGGPCNAYGYQRGNATMGREGLGLVRADALHSHDGPVSDQRSTLQPAPPNDTVFVVDRSRVFSDGLAELLQKAGLRAQSIDLNSLGDPSGWKHARVLVIDGDALSDIPSDALHRLPVLCPGCQVLIITADPGHLPDHVLSATGAVACVSRQVAPKVLIETVYALIQHRPIGRPAALPGSSQLPSVQLTEREYAVLRLLGRALSNEEMAELLGISPNTVRTHVRNLLTKLNVHSRAGAVAVASHPTRTDRPTSSREAKALAR